MPQRVFSQTNKITVFGHEMQITGSATTTTGLVYSLALDKAHLDGGIDLSEFGEVLDMDPSSGTLLVSTRGDMFRKWGYYDPQTRKYTPAGAERGQAFFLNAGLRQHLTSLWKGE